MHPIQNVYSRRQLLSKVGMGLGAVGLGSLLADEVRSAGVTDTSLNPMAERPPHYAPRAKHVIHIFLNGGNSGVDSFDPKPKLKSIEGQKLFDSGPADDTGLAFPSPFRFQKCGQNGTEISELFPYIRGIIDDVCLIRSAHTSSGEHETGLMVMNSGALMSQTTPSVGSWVTYGLGSENQNLPGFVVLCPSDGSMPIKGPENWRSAFLPPIYQGTFIDTNESDAVGAMVRNIVNSNVGVRQQRRQIDLLQRLNRIHLEQRGGDDVLEARIQSYEMAYKMQSAATDAFDISREPEHILKMYGPSRQAKQLLIARRLVERGVRFVQTWHAGFQPWDLHSDLLNKMPTVAEQVDQGIAALVTDLKQRGLLDETLVYWCGEFGRMPTSQFLNGSTLRGRSHNMHGFSVCMAGGGVKAGLVHGSTDEVGHKAVEDPVHVHDLHATILHQLGLDHKQLTYRYAGRDFRLTDVAGEVVHDILA